MSPSGADAVDVDPGAVRGSARVVKMRRLRAFENHPYDG
jgi:hypothetical protein